MRLYQLRHRNFNILIIVTYHEPQFAHTAKLMLRIKSLPGCIKKKPPDDHVTWQMSHSACTQNQCRNLSSPTVQQVSPASEFVIKQQILKRKARSQYRSRGLLSSFNRTIFVQVIFSNLWSRRLEKNDRNPAASLSGAFLCVRILRSWTYSHTNSPTSVFDTSRRDEFDTLSIYMPYSPSKTSAVGIATYCFLLENIFREV